MASKQIWNSGGWDNKFKKVSNSLSWMVRKTRSLVFTLELLVSFAFVIELEYFFQYLEGPIRAIVDDSMSCEHLRSTTCTACAWKNQFAILLKNIKPFRLLKQLCVYVAGERSLCTSILIGPVYYRSGKDEIWNVNISSPLLPQRQNQSSCIPSICFLQSCPVVQEIKVEVVGSISGDHIALFNCVWLWGRRAVLFIIPCQWS